jgi:hypothetical protein
MLPAGRARSQVSLDGLALLGAEIVPLAVSLGQVIVDTHPQR